MPLPPFPEQDLAKLVLGYLAEQQFMTIYDQFLEASPYLDAVTNEYDRIFMTSLRTILAEYRAVKIYLETCKPFSLRKKLSQCNNLVDVIKFLIHHLDTQKLCAHDSRNQTRSSLESVTTQLIKSTICVQCKSIKPGFCKCSNRSVRENDLDFENLRARTELPDSSVSRRYKKNSKSITGDYNLAAVSQDITFERDNMVHLDEHKNPCILPANVPCETCASSKNYAAKSVANDQNLYDTPVNLLGISESSQNYSMNIVNTTSDNNIVNRLDHEADTFQEFATGVQVNNNYNSTVTPNASSSNVRKPLSCYISDYPGESSSTNNMPTNAEGKTHLLRQSTVEKINISSHIVSDVYNKRLDMINIKPKEFSDSSITARHSGQTIKPEEQKVTILSNVRLEQSSLSNDGTNTILKANTSKNLCKVPPVLKGVNSTTTLHTIYVNGTPAYKPNMEKNEQYTKDEIMAMPTIILIPISDVPQNAASSATMTNTTSTINSTESLLTATASVQVPVQSAKIQANKPVVTERMEVEFNTESETITNNKIGTNMGTDIDIVGTSKSDTKNSIVGVLGKTSTPRVPCQTRKSSSTPRRTSHIRVLDFTTPRQVQDTESATLNNAPIVNEFRMRDLPILETIDEQETDTLTGTVKDKTSLHSCIDKDSKEILTSKTQFPVKSCNWDAQLRALAISNEPQDNTTPKTKPKSKPKSVKKNKPQDKEPDKNKNTPKEIHNKVAQKKSNTRKSKSQSSKKKKCSPEVIDDSTGNQTEVVEVPIKPTINVITDWKTAPTTTDKPENNNSTNQETPEMDRVSLQNAFDAKLNISDLLETPYKQALYDIQMETPRFLDSDLPGEPISDVKIMNIPTPRFLTTPGFAVTPKPLQATPSSYASRPTDYSSGGSYYKPDDQDYARIIDDLENPSISPAQDLQQSNALPTTKIECNDSESSQISTKSLRPIRRCTKNVSYYDSPNVSAKKKSSSETLSIHSDLSCSTNCSCDASDKKDKSCATAKKRTTSVQPQKSKLESVKKRHVAIPTKKKSPVKKPVVPKTSSFIKIKPRRPTPIKDFKNNKRTFGLIQKELSKNKLRKKTPIKEKSTNTVTPQLASAPTKSRRKSSTPRKIHCTKELNSDGPSVSPDTVSKAIVMKTVLGPSHIGTEDADIPHLHWSDDGSRDSKPAEVTDMEDINKIKEYITSTEGNKNVEQKNIEGSEKCSNVSECLHIDLIKRGFDIETAKSIERDLLDTSPESSKKEEGLKIAVLPETINEVMSDKDVIKVIEIKKSEPINVVDTKLNESEDSLRNEEKDDESDQEIEFTVSESNQESENYFEMEQDANKTEYSGSPTKLKDTYCMEVCIDDGVTIRLKATPLTMLLDITEVCPDKLNDTLENIDIEETEIAVRSIADIDRLYTPLKDPTSMQDQCVETFDSKFEVDIDSLKTHLKESVDEKPTENPEVTLEVESVAEAINKSCGAKKRKRNQSESDDVLNESKKNKPESQCMATNLVSIQNIDIDSILCRLHGP